MLFQDLVVYRSLGHAKCFTRPEKYGANGYILAISVRRNTSEGTRVNSWLVKKPSVIAEKSNKKQKTPPQTNQPSWFNVSVNGFAQQQWDSSSAFKVATSLPL